MCHCDCYMPTDVSSFQLLHWWDTRTYTNYWASWGAGNVHIIFKKKSKQPWKSILLHFKLACFQTVRASAYMSLLEPFYAYVLDIWSIIHPFYSENNWIYFLDNFIRSFPVLFKGQLLVNLKKNYCVPNIQTMVFISNPCAVPFWTVQAKFTVQERL